ncbi:MAG: peroxiredoxin [Planctomycetota bacterium]
MPELAGKKAPSFALKNQDGKTVKLRDYDDRWVVLYFYPRDSTPGCTVEACEFTAELPQLEGLNAVVLGCSPDSPASHQKFIAKHRLAIDLLSDPDHEVMAKYGAWGEKVLYGKKSTGVIRSTVIIAPGGKIAHHDPKVSAKGHAAAVKQRLQMLQGTV